MARITIPYAVADFIDLRERGFYYVDKTDYIPKLEDYNAPVFLRPRRFGKSLLVSTLACYYDRTKAHRFEELFGGTWIGNHPTKEHNSYMIIRYDFSKMVMADTIEGLAQNFNDLNCGPVDVMVEHNRDLFGDFQFTTRGDASKMLEEVLNYARSHEFPKVYLLIDEYDNFTNQLLTAYNDPLYEEVTTNDSFLRTFFKVIKAGIGEGSIRTCFCTGVLPVTMDDLTSGYNIAEILTLEPNFLNMLGFTYEETETYLRYVLDKYSTGQERFDEIWQLIVSNYDGYRFRPNGDRLFNATILTYFFKKFAANAGSIPDELVDENLRTDINWIRRLTLSLDNAKAMLDALIIDDELPYNFSDLSKKLDKQRVYLLGVDVAVDEYIGELIAVARRRDDPETVWIIAPENISYTIQQIEEMIYFEEQYYDSFVEIVDEELWDAYDENEKLLGFDLKRSQAKSLPDGVYHVIVNVYTMTKDGKLLTTERSRNKTYPLKWEVTGGSILKGETAAEGAVRELYEETGIKISTEDLIVLYSYVDKPKHAIYHSYLNLIEKEVHVTLQEGETMDYMYVPYKEFDELVNSDRFVPSEQRRYKNQAVFTMLSRFIPDSAAST